jgi:hypothetical protein
MNAKNNKPEKKKKEKMEKLENFLLKKAESDLLLEEPEDMLLGAPPEDALFHWKAPEFEIYERDRKWYLYIIIALALIIGWAIYSNGLVMAITFILLGAVGYIHINKTPRILDFIVTDEGVYAEKDFFPFTNMNSFWIIYDPGNKKVISFHTKSHFLPFLHIPIHDEDPVEIREVLLQFIPEIRQEHNMMDTMERLLKL